MGHPGALLLLLTGALATAEPSLPLLPGRIAAVRPGQPLYQAWRVIEDIRGDSHGTRIAQRFGPYGSYVAIGLQVSPLRVLQWQVDAEWGVVVEVHVAAHYASPLDLLPAEARKVLRRMRQQPVIRLLCHQRAVGAADTVAPITQLDLPDEQATDEERIATPP